MGLGCARAHVILEVILEIINPKAIGSKSERINGREKFCAVTKRAEKYPQESYPAVDHEIQSEWIFLKCVTKDMRQAFKGLENFLWETLFTCIFFGKLKTLPLIVGSLSIFPINKSRLSLQNDISRG